MGRSAAQQQAQVCGAVPMRSGGSLSSLDTRILPRTCDCATSGSLRHHQVPCQRLVHR